MEKLNQTILTQQQKIEEQGVAIQSLASSIGTPLDSKGNAKRNWMNVAIAVGVCGSFIMLLAMLSFKCLILKSKHIWQKEIRNLCLDKLIQDLMN